jgi:hypothetical protein
MAPLYKYINSFNEKLPPMSDQAFKPKWLVRIFTCHYLNAHWTDTADGKKLVVERPSAEIYEHVGCDRPEFDDALKRAETNPITNWDDLMLIYVFCRGRGSEIYGHGTWLIIKEWQDKRPVFPELSQHEINWLERQDYEDYCDALREYHRQFLPGVVPVIPEQIVPVCRL